MALKAADPRAINTAKFLMAKDTCQTTARPTPAFKQVWDAAKKQVVTVTYEDPRDSFCSFDSCSTFSPNGKPEADSLQQSHTCSMSMRTPSSVSRHKLEQAAAVASTASTGALSAMVAALGWSPKQSLAMQAPAPAELPATHGAHWEVPIPSGLSATQTAANSEIAGSQRRRRGLRRSVTFSGPIGCSEQVALADAEAALDAEESSCTSSADNALRMLRQLQANQDSNMTGSEPPKLGVSKASRRLRVAVHAAAAATAFGSAAVGNNRTGLQEPPSPFAAVATAVPASPQGSALSPFATAAATADEVSTRGITSSNVEPKAMSRLGSLLELTRAQELPATGAGDSLPNHVVTAARSVQHKLQLNRSKSAGHMLRSSRSQQPVEPYGDYAICKTALGAAADYSCNDSSYSSGSARQPGSMLASAAAALARLESGYQSIAAARQPSSATNRRRVQEI